MKKSNTNKKEPFHKDALKLLKTARGHIDGVINMIEDERYCIDISNQILAIIAILKKANTSVLNKHIDRCVRNAVNSKDVDEKIAELQNIMKYIEKTK
ncbi:MAG TPA: metal-sensing transcriptional repressor [Thermodesulfobium narugense]|uniref:Copper-sensing transcriptional repressor CsoR n=1 Tax=Thermodesulfobium acidiphilum TaxID=1794699 RepID=A0A2R4VZ27_THEAF|nr:metal-sensing transcriptional repressor [Thermodesulfobium acidiphilum]AWB09787.1 DNA-binding transcriptional regulator, FrmR family [Thermodesulfobium acidiphilum]PMP85774.1 MAG: CsoR family transcriptional regulator [Thermodesulfobium narugense]HEM55981.1 metal-sensing transcriptional repressor [Thermodesulfobium narugense]